MWKTVIVCSSDWLELICIWKYSTGFWWVFLSMYYCNNWFVYCKLFYTMMWTLRVLWLVIDRDLLEHRYTDDVTEDCFRCFVQYYGLLFTDPWRIWASPQRKGECCLQIIIEECSLQIQRWMESFCKWCCLYQILLHPYFDLSCCST